MCMKKVKLWFWYQQIMEHLKTAKFTYLAKKKKNLKLKVKTICVNKRFDLRKKICLILKKKIKIKIK